jgi:hypothetical protein
VVTNVRPFGSPPSTKTGMMNPGYNIPPGLFSSGGWRLRSLECAQIGPAARNPMRS